MQFKTLILASVASVALAQTTTSAAPAATTSSSCLAQNILDACEATIQGQINACATTDYSCLCTQYGNMLQCYANCPNDLGVGTVQQQRELYCNDASVYGSTTTLGTAKTTATVAATTTGAGASAQSGFASGTSTASGAGASSTSKSAADMTTANGLLALLAAGVAALL